MKYISQGPMLLDVHMHRPHTTTRNFMDALLAFWPGLQVSGVAGGGLGGGGGNWGLGDGSGPEDSEGSPGDRLERSYSFFLFILILSEIQSVVVASLPAQM